MGIFVFLCAALSALAALLAWKPRPDLWGLSSGADLDPLLLTAWAVVAIFAAGGAAYAARLEPRKQRASDDGGGRKIARDVAAAAALFLFFFLFRSRNLYLGDGYLVAHLIERVEPVRELRPEWFALALCRALYRLLGALSVPASGAIVAAMVSSAAGVVFVGAVRSLAGSLASLAPPAAARPVRLLTAAVLLGGAEVQLYFGYVESYTLSHLFLFLFLVSGIRAIVHGKGALLAGLFLFLAVLGHAVTAMTLAPAALYLFSQRREGVVAAAGRALALPAAAAIYVALLTLSQLDVTPFGAFVPWVSGGTDEPFGILSAEQLRFIGNLLLLLAPIPSLLILLSLRGGRRGPAPAADVGRFTGIAALSSFGFACVMNPYLGPRDWDLLSFFAAPVAVWAVVRYAVAGRARSLRSVSVVAAATAAILLFPWIAGNASPPAAARRATRLALHDVHHYRGDDIKAVSLAGMLWDRGERELPLRLYEEAAHRRPDSYITRYNLGVVFWGEDRFEEALPHLRRAIDLRPELHTARYFLGSTLFHLERDDLGEKEFRRFLEEEPENPSAASYLGRILMWKGEWGEAKERLLVARKGSPGDAKVRVWLGQTCYALGENAEAAGNLRGALELDPDLPRAREALDALEAEGY